MKNRLLKLLSLLVIVFSSFVAGFGQTAEAAKQNSSPAAAVGAPGLLYQITGNGLKSPSYLFGTVHLVCVADMLPMEKLGGYLDQTQRLVLEIDMDDAAEMQALQTGLLLPGGKSSADHLKPEEIAKIDELTKNTLGLPFEKLKTFRPLMLQTMIIGSPKAIGCNPPASYDLALLQAAAQKKKPVDGLESAASQLALMDSQPLERQSRQLYETALDPEKSFGEFRKLLETYKRQDSEALYQFIDGQTPAADREFFARMLDARNLDWIPKIEKMIAEKPSFIAVGGGHLGGKKGVVNLLRAKGYRVRAIKL